MLTRDDEPADRDGSGTLVGEACRGQRAQPVERRPEELHHLAARVERENAGAVAEAFELARRRQVGRLRRRKPEVERPAGSRNVSGRADTLASRARDLAQLPEQLATWRPQRIERSGANQPLDDLL